METTQPEAVRRTTSESDMKASNDLRLYESIRADRERDDHIAYARDGRDKIVEGYSLEWVVEQLLSQVPSFGMDIALVVEYLNYFLKECGQNVRFDQNCNVYVDGVETIHTDAGDLFAEAKIIYDKWLDEMALNLARKGGELLINGLSFNYIKIAISGDIVWYKLNNTLVAHCLNEYLNEQGSTIKVDPYLNLIEK